MSVAIVYPRAWVKGLGLPLVSGVSEDVLENSIRHIVVKFKELIGEELAEKLDNALDEALKNEISKALNTDKLDEELYLLVEKFWIRIASPLSQVNDMLLGSIDKSFLRELVELEKKIGETLARMIRRTNYRYAEELVYGLSALIDYDKWVIEKIFQLGIDAFVKKLIDRASKTFIEFINYALYLIFTWIASTAAILGIIKEYREENLDKLAKLCKQYAEELEDYIDTLDILLNDETYEELVRLGLVKRQQ